VKTAVRASTPADGPGILQVLKAAGLRPNLDLAYLQWKYWEPRPDWEGPRSFVVTRDNDIVSHAGIVPGHCLWGPRRFRVIHPVDWAARPGEAGAGVAVMKHISSLADVLLAIGGSQHTVRLLPHIGFKFAGNAMGYARPVRPLRLFGAPAGPWWKVLPRFARRAFWMMSAPHRGSTGWSLRLLDGGHAPALAPVLADSERGRTLARTPQEGMAVLARSAESLSFALRCPIAPTRLFAAERHGQMLGYVLLSFPPGQARIADCWVSSDDVHDWCAVIQCAVGIAWRERTVSELVAWASDPMLQHALTTCGFHPRTREAIQIRATVAFPAPPASLRVQMIDSDSAYQHAGRPQLWT
jgi:hypothetical protein